MFDFIDRFIVSSRFLMTEFDFLDVGNNIPKNGMAKLGDEIDKTGLELYDLMFKISVFAAVLSFVFIVISRLIFRIASPREDARAKMMIQAILVTIFLLSMVTTVFSAVMKMGEAV